jgi:hypothetical protein
MPIEKKWSNLLKSEACAIVAEGAIIEVISVILSN